MVALRLVNDAIDALEEMCHALDPTKASKELGWEAKTSLEELVNEMIKKDLSLAKKELLISN